MFLLDLPEELLLLIFEQLNLFTIFQCSLVTRRSSVASLSTYSLQVCTKLYRLHIASVSLYESELARYGRRSTALRGSTVDPLDSIALSSHLYFLDRREKNWRALTPHRVMPQSLLAFDNEFPTTRRRMWSLKDGLLTLGHRFRVQQPGWDLHMYHIPSHGDGCKHSLFAAGRSSWLIDYVTDPIQDLVLIIHYT